jgi:hypothetical protein
MMKLETGVRGPEAEMKNTKNIKHDFASLNTLILQKLETLNKSILWEIDILGMKFESSQRRWPCCGGDSDSSGEAGPSRDLLYYLTLALALIAMSAYISRGRSRYASRGRT